jgi:hypothetical protein
MRPSIASAKMTIPTTARKSAMTGASPQRSEQDLNSDAGVLIKHDWDLKASDWHPDLSGQHNGRVTCNGDR